MSYYNDNDNELKKAGLIFLGTLLTLGLLSLCSPAKADEIFIKEVVNPVYKIQQGASVCSSVALDFAKMYPEKPAVPVTPLLTAKHCIDPLTRVGKVLIEKNTGHTKNVDILDYKAVMVSSKYDLALIVPNDIDSKIKSGDKAVIADTQKAVEGDVVYSVGYPLGMTRTVTQGFLGESDWVMNPISSLTYMTQASTLIDRGMSGGPLYQKNGNDYEVIGIASTKSQENNFINQFVSLNDIKDFIANGS